MTDILPWAFASLTLVVMAFAIFALWQSFRALSGALHASAVLSPTGSVEQQALESEKAALLDSLRDLKFEWQVGKLSDEDYREQEQLLRQRTRQVMRHLEQAVEPYREKAKQLVTDRIGPLDVSEDEDVGDNPSPVKAQDAEAGTSDPGPAPVEAAREPASVGGRLVCVKCGTENDNDATFCKRCGEPMQDDRDGSGAS